MAKITLVTGGNTGIDIGYETVKQLLLKNAKVYLAARSPEKAAAAIKRLEQETNKLAIFLQLDLADLPSVRKAAETFLAQESRLDILFNNGGVMTSPPEQLTAQNYDLQFGTNVLGHFFLTELLVRELMRLASAKLLNHIEIPALTKSYDETKSPARLVHTSSIGHQMAPGDGMEYASLKGKPECDAWLKTTGTFTAPWRLYGESKIGNILISNSFANHYSDVLVSCAVHPGGINTELARSSKIFWCTRLYEFSFLVTPPDLILIILEWEPIHNSGARRSQRPPRQPYLIPWGKVGTADKRASSMKLKHDLSNSVS
ncbi:NAD-P-binding protein [Mycena vulgaris]|nr:NAD-P-binding protein [Mycena vulgaris]